MYLTILPRIRPLQRHYRYIFLVVRAPPPSLSLVRTLKEHFLCFIPEIFSLCNTVICLELIMNSIDVKP